MERLLILSDDPALFTGLARCVRELADRLRFKYEIAIAGWHAAPTRHAFPYHIYPLTKGDPEEPRHMLAVLHDFKPQKLLCIGDLWDFAYLSSTLWEYRGAFPNEPLDAYLWTTPDGEWTEYRWEEIVRLFSRVASFSHFGVREIHRLAKIDCPVIYPGVDTNVFSRPSVIEYSPDAVIDPRNNFIILTVAQNTSRKNLPIALEAFAQFLKIRPNAHYILVTDPNDPVGYNLIHIARWYGILKTKKIYFVKQSPREGVTDKKLNLNYIVAHAFLLPSIGEGAALPLFECMASRVTPIGTNYSAIPEVIGDRGFVADVATHMFGAYGVRRALVSPDSIVQHLTTIYDDWASGGKLIGELGEKQLEFAKTYSWDRTANEILTWLDTPIAPPTFVFQDVPKHQAVCMVIPSWGQACGIADYTRQLVTSIQGSGVPVTVYPSRDIHEILKIQEEKKFGVVHIQHEFSFFPDKYVFEKSLAMLRKAGLKIVLTMHSATRLLALNQSILRLVDRILVHSHQQRNIFLNGAESSTVRVIPMGCGAPVAVDGFVSLRQQLGIAGRSPIIGSFGFLRDQKGFHVVAASVKALTRKYPDALFFLVSPKHAFGHQAYDDRFYNFIRNEDLEKQIFMYREFLPEEQLVRTLQCADLFVMNYADMPEGGGVSAAIKAVMRTQRPILATKTLSFSDLSEEVIWIGPNEHPLDLAAQIDAVLSDKVTQDNVVNAANEYLLKNSWTEAAKKHQEIYQS